MRRIHHLTSYRGNSAAGFGLVSGFVDQVPTHVDVIGAEIQQRELLDRLEHLEWWQRDVLPHVGGDGKARVSAVTPTWWLHEVLPHVAGSNGVEILTAATVLTSPSLRGRPLGELLPGLSLARRGTPCDFLESVRASNVVTRHSANTWSDLASYSADRLSTWPNAGRKVVTEVIRAAVQAWTEVEPAGGAVELASVAAQTVAPTLPETLSREGLLLRRLADAGYRAGACTLGEAFQLAAAGVIGADAWTELESLPLECLLDLGSEEEAWRALLCFDKRELRIAEARIFCVGSPETLGGLGEELGVTRERVRQVEKRMKEQIEARRSTDARCRHIEHVAARVRRRLGSIASDETMTAALRDAVSDAVADFKLRRAVLVSLAGPYRTCDGFWQRGSPVEDARAALSARVDEPLTDEDISEIFDGLSISNEVRLLVIAALPLHPFDGRLLVWTGSLADKAHRLLRVHGEAMSRAELHGAMGGTHVNFRSMLTQIQGDTRFRRLGLDRYGLSEWGGEEYTTIVDEIEQAIERRGGKADVDAIVAELVELFGVSAQSVRSYAASRRFHRSADGLLTVAAAGQAGRAIPMAPEMDRDLMFLQGAWTVRVVVDREVLRGSGRPVRSAIAQAAGVWPGGARTIRLAAGTAAISWRGNQPAFGSTRALVEALGCVGGDLLFVPLEDGKEAFAISRTELDAATGTRRLALEMGLTADASIDAVLGAVGLAPEVGVADLRARLRARQQVELEALLPQSDDGNDDDLLDQLMGLGG